MISTSPDMLSSSCCQSTWARRSSSSPQWPPAPSLSVCSSSPLHDHHHLSPALQHAGRWMKGSCSPLCLVRSGSQRLNNSTLQVYSSLNYWYYYSTPTSGANIYYSKLLTVGGHLCFCRLPVSTHASIDTLGFINVKTYFGEQCTSRLFPLILWFSSNLLLYCSVNNVQCLDRTDNSEVHTKTWP